MKHILITTLMLTLIALAGCGGDTHKAGLEPDGPPDGPGPADEVPIPDEDADFPVATDGKSDTGYLSDLATELEGIYESSIRLPVSSLPEEAREDPVAYYTGSGRLSGLIDNQMKYGKKQLNTEKLHINLSSWGSERNEEVRLDGDFLVIEYSVRVETIVSYEELEENGVSPEDIKDRSYGITLPGDPQDLFTRVGDKCAEGFDEGSLADFNYFYYFAPEKEGCELDRVDATFTVHSLLPSKTTYPEYHLLKADGEVTAIVFFGTAKHDWKPGDWDWGVYEHDQLIRAMRGRGFRKEGSIEPAGTRYVRERGGVKAIMDVIAPADMVDRESEKDAIFVEMVKTHEIVIYNGHSFYGSLDVLDSRSNFPEDTYQIFSMNSCWSYEYYTKQIFQNKTSAADEKGWALADVVNDTEAGWFHNNAEISRILLTNVFKGAEVNGRDGDRYYTWANIIGAMNKQAIDDWRRRGSKSHEIFGVSGVRTNVFDPDNPNPDPVEPPEGEWTREDKSWASPHPYANDTKTDFWVEAPEEAKQVQISFSMFELEEDYDFVELYDANENFVERFTGELGAFVTKPVTGNKVLVRFTSDYSITYQGWEIDGYDWR